MIDGFKKFIARGNMIDMAVGVVMGSAVTAVVNAIVDNLINPLVAMLFGKPDMSGLLAFTFNGATVSFGAVLGALLNFLMIAVAVYFGVLMPINKLRDMSEALLVKAKLKEAEDAKAADDTAVAKDSADDTAVGKTSDDAGAKASDDVAAQSADGAVAKSVVGMVAQNTMKDMDGVGAAGVMTASAVDATVAPNAFPNSPAVAMAANRQIVELLTEIRDQLANQPSA